MCRLAADGLAALCLWCPEPCVGAGSGFPELCLVQPRILAGQEGTPGPLLSQSRITEPWNGLWEGRKESFLCARLPQPSLAMGTKPLQVAIPVSLWGCWRSEPQAQPGPLLGESLAVPSCSAVSCPAPDPAQAQPLSHHGARTGAFPE